MKKKEEKNTGEIFLPISITEALSGWLDPFLPPAREHKEQEEPERKPVQQQKR
ncbi:MAG: hypothetical protein HYV32_04400 [Candidatus Kerfeldbacteria bacterium]|nr:hypothetical protein [Candidatus Kerfeldbacteria bacterium]